MLRYIRVPQIAAAILFRDVIRHKSYCLDADIDDSTTHDVRCLW